MNLVQINERLKDVPEMALKQYINGSNPMVPPYLALGELERREKVKQQMANEQGAAQGQQPSVKEQIEQKAGLMGLQQAQLQQQQAQMMQPRPGPVPAGVPQPQDQPEVQEMAYGGVARLPVRDDLYRFAGGGIIAFQQGGQSPRVITIPAGTSDEEIDRIRRENPDAILRPEAPVAPQALAQAPAAAPALAQAGVAGLQRSPLMDQAVAAAQQQPEKPTAAGVIAQQNELLPIELQEAARQKRAQEAMARAEESKRAFEASRPSGLDQLIKVFGQAGQYKGLTGLGPAYTQNRERLAAEEAGFRREQEAARAKAEEQQLGEASALFGARSKDLAAQNEAYRKQLSSRTESLAHLAGTDQRAIDAALGRISDKEIAKMRIIEANRPGESERINAEFLRILQKDGQDKANDYLTRMMQIKGATSGGGFENAKTRARRQEMLELQQIMEDKAMIHSDENKKWAAKRYSELARQNAGDEGNGFEVTVGGKTYTFPTKEAADNFKKEAGVK